MEKDLWCPPGFKPAQSAAVDCTASESMMRQHLAYFEAFDFPIKDVKPLIFAKVVFRKKNLGCFTFFPINISRSVI